jgi:16S rRNA U1498 N3-methylase RsmE
MLSLPRRIQERQRRRKTACSGDGVRFVAVACIVVVIHCISLGRVTDAFTLCHYYHKTATTRPRRRKCISTAQSRGCGGTSYCDFLTRVLLNRFLFDPSEVTATEPGMPTPSGVPTVTLPKDDYRTMHAAKVLGLQNGDTIRAGIVSCPPEAAKRSSATTFCTNHGLLTDTATIQWIPGPQKKEVKETAQTSDGSNPPPGSSLRIHLHSLQEPINHTTSSSSLLGVSLILALPRPLQLGRILPMIAQMGVDHLVLMHATKVPRDYFGSHLFVKPHQLTSRLVEGLCQAGTDVRLPTVHVIRPGRDYRHFWGKTDKNSSSLLLNRLFPMDEYARVVAHPQRVAVSVDGTATPPPRSMRNIQFPQTSSSSSEQQQQQQRKLVLAVGPEGGWAEPDELDMLVDAGFQLITMGPRVLRSDCAVVSLLALAHDAVAADDR